MKMEMKGDPGLAPTRPLGEGRGDQEGPKIASKQSKTTNQLQATTC